ncbi:MAG: PA14 domain-containing protein [Candidatus Nanopelagicaceae bacterium]
MTRNKAWRLTLTAILTFGWLFLVPAEGNPDPLTAAAEDIAELNANIDNLVNKIATQDLIDIAESKYDDAVAAKSDMENKEDLVETKQGEYDAAVEAEAIALEEMNLAQQSVDGQTVTVATALQDKDDAQDDLDIANINLQTAQIAINNAGNAGLQYTVYHLARGWNGEAITDGVICTGVWNSNSMQPPVCGYYEDFIVKFTGKITVPSHWTTTYFAGYTDDGFRMYVDGQLAINNWQEQGSAWSAYSPVYDVSEDKTLDVEIWWYQGGGPGYYHLGWAIPGGWTGAGCDFTGGWGVGFSCNLNTFSYGEGATQAQIDAYNEAVSAKAEAQTIYNNKLSYYNTQNNLLTQYQNTLSTKTSAYNNSVSAKNNAYTDLTNATNDYNNAVSSYSLAILDMQEAIIDAQEEYAKQWDFEERQRIAAAIAQALANQPQPEPTPEPKPTPQETIEPKPTPEPEASPSSEPTPEPSVEPSPEQTEPSDPTPAPDSETTDEPKPEPTPQPEPTPEPSPEPSPQPSDIDPEPTPEPEPTPVEPSVKPSPINNTTEDLTRVLANLTSKDNVVVKLTPEQMAAVSSTLTSLTIEAKIEVAKDFGIKTEEVAIIAELAADNPAVAAAVISFAEKAEENADAPMPYTLADAVTEAQTEQLLADPIGALTNIDFEKVFSPSEWGKDMTDDQREKAQEVIVPVIIAGNIIAAAMTRRI